MKFAISSKYSNYISNTSWLMGEKILRLVIAMVIGIYVARYLGPEKYGVLSYAIGFVGLFSAIATLGLDAIVVREIVRLPGERNIYLGTSFMLKLFGVLAMWTAIALIVPITNNDHETNILIAIVAIATIFQAVNVVDFNYQAEVKSRYVVYGSLIQLFVSSIAKIILVQINAEIIWFALVVILDGLILAISLTIIYMAKTGALIDWTWRFSIAKKLLKDSWVIILYTSFVFLNINIDRVMIGMMLDNHSVGIYSAASSLSIAWYFIPVAIGSTFYPYIVKNKNSANYKKNIDLLFSSLFFISLIGALFVFFFSGFISENTFGHQYSGMAEILVVHIFTGFFVFHVSIRTKILASDNYQSLSATFMFLGASLNILLNYYLISQSGIIGAAYASFISWAANVLLFPLLSGKTRLYIKIFMKSPLFPVKLVLSK